MLFAFNVGAQVHVNEVGSADVDSITIIDTIDVDSIIKDHDK